MLSFSMSEASGDTHESHSELGGGSHGETYADALRRFREEKDRLFRTDPASPIETAGFAGLHYYPISEAWRVVATLEPLPAQNTGQLDGVQPDAVQLDAVQLTTSVGDTQPYHRVGRAHFTVAGQTCALTLYRPTFQTANAHLFVPFRDATSGGETYGAGRYLEASAASAATDGHVVLDFNRCYHPLCAYSARYRCPLPPAENYLDVAVHAGEKL